MAIQNKKKERKKERKKEKKTLWQYKRKKERKKERKKSLLLPPLYALAFSYPIFGVPSRVCSRSIIQS